MGTINKFGNLEYKEDNRPQRGGWAPGNYINRCGECQSQFVGDKRAVWCADCAYDDEGLQRKEEQNDDTTLVHNRKSQRHPPG
jgi:hypothetical protein